MKVLFCSPYLNSPDIVKGGIGIWAQNIMSYYLDTAQSDVGLLPVSFDRKTYISDSITFFSRIKCGIQEMRTPLSKSLQLIRDEKPDVVHVCTSAGLALFRDYILAKAAKRKGVKVVMHFHFGRIPVLAKQKNWEWMLLKKVLLLCDTPIVMDKASEKTLLDAGFSQTRYLPNPLGEKVTRHVAEVEGKIVRESRSLLFVGHVLKTKGVIELVKACARVPNIKLRVVGKILPGIQKEIENIVKMYKNDGWLTIVGEMTQEEVIREFWKADLFVFPSYTEGFPNVILEAMACCCPIVASNVGAIPEMLNIGKDPCGVCFLPRSEEEVYKAIVSVIDNEQMKSNFAKKAKERVFSNYTIPVVWQQLTDIWRNNI